ncbi:Putative auto-transporter adhesin, head GIN domain [Salegentibacter echinorum]|uniref:Putative auto-transporter adhesin, head GIN domain n=1 Tax=Salegentibacter echinorum TaxID=1073325 RepID=A0A1M5GDL6_SALEC|nr:head GIN domain-containing protein [Salegentibacter echinorum]SHG01552.1 Putative auto-transporter adhesin, head GIN domain [Salegentibacter echinorum]
MIKKIFSIGIILSFVLGCSPDEAGTCLKGAGDIVTYEVEVAPFNEIMVYERVKLFIEQGDKQKIKIETGKNLKEEVSVEVTDSRLNIRNNNACNLFRDYEVTKVYVTVTNLTWLQNSSGSAIETLNTLKQENLWLRSVNQEDDLSIHTDGDFKLSLDVGNLRITNDNYSNYFLKGVVENFNVFFAAGDGRLEARELAVQHYDIFHRGTNKMFLNPIKTLSGEIRSSGDVISINRPTEVSVESFYTGKLIFETP